MTTENIDKEQIQEEQKEEQFDYKKAREERITKSTEKRILKDLGEESFESIKNKLKRNKELEEELSKQINNGKILSSYKAGIDDKFVDYVTYEVNKKLKPDQKFEDALKAYTKDNPQFLRSTPSVSFKTSPNFEDQNVNKFNSNNWMNNFLRGDKNGNNTRNRFY